MYTHDGFWGIQTWVCNEADRHSLELQACVSSCSIPYSLIIKRYLHQFEKKKKASLTVFLLEANPDDRKDGDVKKKLQIGYKSI